MRTALGPRLTSATFTRVACLGSRLYQYQCVTAQLDSRPAPPSLRAHYSTKTAAVQKWPLRDLRDISRKTPLIFHLTSDNPYYNLSIEHYILVNSDPASRILLFYTNRPCVVIGRNQNPWLETDVGRLRAGGQGSKTNNASADNLHSPIDLIRRRSGGGTVFHDDGNLNYSVTVPNTTKSFTRSLHAEMVVRALSPLSPRLGFTDLKVNDRNDIVMRSNSLPETSAPPTWLKVSGSAYKLTKGRALHHGTLLFSSPNLANISSLLRGPGHDFIEAKGVESVRSKVGNLAWTDDLQQRAQTKQAITDAICTEFWDMYGQSPDDQARIPRQKGYNEIYLDETEADERQNPEIAAGVAELSTRQWTFDQTPRFDFTSPVVDGVQIKFHADRGGLLHRISLHRDGGHVLVLALDKDDLARRLTPTQGIGEQMSQFIQDGGRIRTVTDWKGLLTALFVDPTVVDDDVHIPEALIQRIEEIFPYISVGSETK